MVHCAEYQLPCLQITKLSLEILNSGLEKEIVSISMLNMSHCSYLIDDTLGVE